MIRTTRRRHRPMWCRTPDYGYPSSSSDQRYLPQYNGYDSNYIGPVRERQLQGHDY